MENQVTLPSEVLAKMVTDLYELNQELDFKAENLSKLSLDVDRAREVLSPLFYSENKDHNIHYVAELARLDWEGKVEQLKEVTALYQSQLQKVKETEQRLKDQKDYAFARLGPLVAPEVASKGFIFDLVDSAASQIERYVEVMKVKPTPIKAKAYTSPSKVPDTVLGRVREGEEELAALEEADREDPLQVGLQEKLTDARGKMLQEYRNMFSYYTTGKPWSDPLS